MIDIANKITLLRKEKDWSPRAYQAYWFFTGDYFRA